MGLSTVIGQPQAVEAGMATLAAGMARGLSFEEMVPPLCAY